MRATPCGRFLRRNVRRLLPKGCCTFGTCRKVNSNYSANEDLKPLAKLGPQCAGYLSLSLASL